MKIMEVPGIPKKSGHRNRKEFEKILDLCDASTTGCVRVEYDSDVQAMNKTATIKKYCKSHGYVGYTFASRGQYLYCKRDTEEVKADELR